MGKDGQIFFQSDGSVKLKDGTKITRHITYRGKRYSLVGAVGDKKRAQNSAQNWRRQFGGALVKQLAPGNYGIYSTV